MEPALPEKFERASPEYGASDAKRFVDFMNYLVTALTYSTLIIFQVQGYDDELINTFFGYFSIGISTAIVVVYTAVAILDYKAMDFRSEERWPLWMFDLLANIGSSMFSILSVLVKHLEEKQSKKAVDQTNSDLQVQLGGLLVKWSSNYLNFVVLTLIMLLVIQHFMILKPLLNDQPQTEVIRPEQIPLRPTLREYNPALRRRFSYIIVDDPPIEKISGRNTSWGHVGYYAGTSMSIFVGFIEPQAKKSIVLALKIVYEVITAIGITVVAIAYSAHKLEYL